MSDEYERYLLYIYDEIGNAVFDCWYPDEANAAYDLEERGLYIAETEPMEEADGSESLVIYAVPSIIMTD